ncbi:hypothetical protein HMPREF9012_2070 [Bacteroidetes bacterium oral taxon 272 str. F0290]|nr:hypothetical protein [Phocaeicola abscessus]EPT32921.1 hypothetical protein HMPREF9012_2070 [Bacteroidetes bacterium oral taxon 272 str. F0290]
MCEATSGGCKTVAYAPTPPPATCAPCLRAIYNKAATKRLVKAKEPFKGVFTGNDKTVKRSITIKEICKSASGAIRLFGQPLESPF